MGSNALCTHKPDTDPTPVLFQVQVWQRVLPRTEALLVEQVPPQRLRPRRMGAQKFVPLQEAAPAPARGQHRMPRRTWRRFCSRHRTPGRSGSVPSALEAERPQAWPRRSRRT